MDRNKRTAVVVLVAVLLAAAASLGMYRVVSRRPAPQGEVSKTVDVVVAQHPLQLGTRLTKDHVKLIKWPAETQVAGAFAKAEDVLDRGLIATVDENEPLTAAKLAPLGAGAGLPPSIPPGMRAVSVKVNEVVGVAGFVVPGTRVDVMVTLTNRQAQQESMTRVVVSNVQVLTAGTRYDQENAKDGKPIPSTVVTLLVSPEDGERIALAASEGQIMLTLRNPLDTTPTATSGVRTTALLGQTAVPAPAALRAPRASAPAKSVQPEPAAAPAAKLYTVEAIRGAKRSEETVR
jgi:pilus assembly protein CpaB